MKPLNKGGRDDPILAHGFGPWTFQLTTQHPEQKEGCHDTRQKSKGASERG